MQPDYKSLFEQAVYHLNAVSGSRNSFTNEAREALYKSDGPLRDPVVEGFHQDAVAFLGRLRKDGLTVY